MKQLKKGFTLIELLVVIAIIALLMSILAPALTNVMEQAKDALGLARQHEWSLVFATYANDNDSQLTGWHCLNTGDTTYCDPDETMDASGCPTGSPGFHEHCWVPRLRRYWADPFEWVHVDAGAGDHWLAGSGGGEWYCASTDWEFAMCPAAETTWADGEFGGPKNGWDLGWLADTFPAGEYWPYYGVAYGAYGKNSWVTNSRQSHGECITEVDDFCKSMWETTRVRHASRVPLFGCATMMGGFSNPTSWTVNGLLNTERVRHPMGGGVGEMGRWFIDRHNGKINMVMLDFTVKEVGLRQLWQLHWQEDWNEYLSEVPDPRDMEIWPKWARTAPMFEFGF